MNDERSGADRTDEGAIHLHGCEGRAGDGGEATARSSVLLALFVGLLVACTAGEERARAPASTSARDAPAAEPDRHDNSEPTKVSDSEIDAGTPWPPAAPPRIDTDWCIAGMSVLDEATCYVLPDAPTRTLLIYLHGIVPPTRDSAQKTNVQTVVANASRRAGVAALMPRGRIGLAPKGFESWWGWPTTVAAYRQHGARFASGFVESRRRLERLVGVSFAHVYVAGSSSGGYFAAALALHGAIEADGFGAMSGGAGHPTPELPKLAPKPFYVGFGAHDTVADSARALGDLLRRAGWPVRVAEHPVGHGAKEIYLDEAFAFWREHAVD